jgi:hypothetical protein
MNIKQKIAVFFSSVAMLALLLHGFIPHHHHDSETEQCNLETEQLFSGDHSCNSYLSFNSETNFCADLQHSGHSHAHVCNLNVDDSRQTSITLLAVLIKTFTLQEGATLPVTIFSQDSESFIPSNFYEVRSLRAPPLG